MMDSGTELEIPESQQIPDSQNTHMDEISHHFVGAPEVVGSILLRHSDIARTDNNK